MPAHCQTPDGMAWPGPAWIMNTWWYQVAQTAVYVCQMNVAKDQVTWKAASCWVRLESNALLIVQRNLFIKITIVTGHRWPQWQGDCISRNNFLWFTVTEISWNSPSVGLIARWLYFGCTAMFNCILWNIYVGGRLPTSAPMLNTTNLTNCFANKQTKY